MNTFNLEVWSDNFQEKAKLQFILRHIYASPILWRKLINQ